jgi:hypothetical protein
MHLQTFLLAVYNHEILVDELSVAAASAQRVDSPDSLLTAPIRRGPSSVVVTVHNVKPRKYHVHRRTRLRMQHFADALILYVLRHSHSPASTMIQPS